MSRTETEPVRQIVNLPRLGTLVALILLVAGGAYWFGANSVRLKEVPALWALGMDQPSENRLDPKFRDADANLVADPPADEADWLDPSVLTFSYLATDQDEYEEVWSEVLKFVGERCGRTVEFRRQESPDTQLAGLDSGVLHIAGINSGAVPVAVNQSGFIPLCSFGADGKLALYAMKVITRKDSPIQKVSDLRGRRVALTDPTSNSGWKAPLHLLKSKHDMTPILDYDIVATGGHANSIKAIAAGEQEVAAVASDELLLAQARGEISEADYRVIFESDPFCNNTIGCTHRLKPELVESVKRALLEFKWDDSRLATQFSTIGAKQFVEVSFKDDFGLLREIDDAMGRRTREMLGRKF